jgi:hypothetical protein
MKMKLKESGLYKELRKECKVLYMNLAYTGQMVTNIVVFGNGSFTDTMDATARRRRFEQLSTIRYMKMLFTSKSVEVIS